MKKNNSIHFLSGDKKINSLSLQPYNPIICEFLDNLSKSLNKDKNAKIYPDLKTLAFWCRKKNIEIMKKKFSSTDFRIGLGLLFHITPSNVPTNFAYSLIFGLLTGNTNIVKVPHQKFEQVKIICNNINKIVKAKKFSEIKNMIKIVRYHQNDEYTKNISKICDARIIWGGDDTIKNIRNFKLQERSLDIAFSDRFSFCVINAKKFLQIKKFEKQRLFEKFYNDTYLVDQNACSSPHLILWINDNKTKVKNLFWKGLSEYLKKNYNLPELGLIDKQTKLYMDLASSNNIKSHKVFSNFLYLVRLKKLDDNICSLRGKWGYFYEYDINNLDQISKFIKKNCQTLSYFGLSKDYLSKFIRKNHLKGIDRIVPIGQALEIDFNWDGYDLNRILTRIVDLK